MPFQTDLPEWNKADDAKPAQSKLDAGWSATEKPPASIFNWFFNRTAKAIKDLVNNAINKDQINAANGVAPLDGNKKVPTVNLPDASTTGKGQTQLNDNINSTSTTQAATANAVKTAYDLAAGKYSKPAGGVPKSDLDATVSDALAPYAAAAGSANAYTATFTPAFTALKEGMAIRVKINLDNTGASTINVNGLGAKPIKRANGNDVNAGNLKNGSIYTLAYNGTNFILQGEGGAEGTAQASDVLTGQTFTNGNGDVVTGTMPNNGAVSITPGTAAKAIPAGYHNGSGSVAGDPNLNGANIKKGVSIFGVAGSSTVIDTNQGTGAATAGDLLTGKTAFVNGATVNGTMPNNGAVTINPGATDQTIAAGYHSGAGVVKGSANLIAGNIRAGVNIFGITGATNVIDTTKTTGQAAAADILTGKGAFVNGAAVNGSMANNGAVAITPGTSAKTIPAGYHNGAGTVAGDANLAAGNIAKDTTIFGVTGTLERVTTINKSDMITSINAMLAM